MYDARVSGELLVWLGDGAIDAVGGKAAGLAMLIEAGLPVPPGMVVTTAAYRAGKVPAVDMPGPLAVRSSATIEDGKRGAAPGLFDTILNVEPDGLADAIRAVWASARTPAVDAYLAARNISREDLAIAVVVQQQVGPVVERGTLYSRLPGDREAPRMLIERGDGEWREVDRDDDSDLAELAREAERALDCDGVDVEWVRTDSELWIVQARPIPVVPPAPSPPPELFAFSRGDTDTVWRWDVAHNPDPLSPAQIGLVERVSRGEMRVVDSYLYVADTGDANDGDPGEIDFEALDEMERALDAGDGSLESALATYEAVYRIYADTLSPALRAARAELPAFLARHLPRDDVERTAHTLLGASASMRLETMVAAVAHGMATRDELVELAAPLAPAWDVAVPTYGERPELLDAAIDAAHASSAADDAAEAEQRLRARLPAQYHDELDEVLATAHVAADLAELDDRYFARAQAAVRAALLGLGHGDDIFYVPLADVVAGAFDLTGAAGARAELERQRRRAMPLAFRDGAPLPATPVADTDCWKGRGCGGHARGRVVRLDSLADTPTLGPDTILVVPSVTPAMTFVLHRAKGIVSEHGGLLDHGAAIARELALPCVVGCTGAWTQLSDGDDVWIDGQTGTVVRLGSR